MNVNPTSGLVDVYWESSGGSGILLIAGCAFETGSLCRIQIQIHLYMTGKLKSGTRRDDLRRAGETEPGVPGGGSSVGVGVGVCPGCPAVYFHAS